MKGEYKMKSSIKHIGEEKYSKYGTLAKIIEQNNLYNALCNYKVEITD